ncbi:MAG: hypothetical protein HQL80_05890 [Magnetococcales bacterium]|nr:hypothetical protein [Magnetococcales bacterium]
MNAGLIGQYSSVQQGSQFMEAGGIFSRSPVAVGGESRAVLRRDAVDLLGLDTIDRAFKLLNEQDTIPVPEAVGRAIRTLVQQVLDELPGGGRL